jgi:predicted metalloprotease with PDZ domain
MKFKHLRLPLSIRPLRRAALSLLMLLACCCVSARAQSIKASISLLQTSPPRVRVEGERAGATVLWSFRNVYASVVGIGERIENLTLADARGSNVPVRKLAAGEWKAESPADRFSYEVKLDAPVIATDAAYVSWLNADQGFLMLGDLLPLSGDGKATNASMLLVLPPGWNAGTTETRGASGRYEIKDTERAVFFVGRALRERRSTVGPMEFSFVTTGEWAFTDEDAARMASSILKEHGETFGGSVQGRVLLALAPFPRPLGPERWSAETRGRTVTLLSGRSPSKVAALARLSVPLTHELFHLWVPNALALDGEYDWFYEGFTMYQAMRAAVQLNLLIFEDFLDAVGRSFDAYASARERDKLSLVAQSERRWTGSPALIYQKGMLVAFLYDLTLRQSSGGKRSLDDVYRTLFRRYRTEAARTDGNRAVLDALNEQAEMRDFTRRYVESANTIDLATAIAPFGLRVESGGVRTHLSVANSLKREQRDLLRKFGYNADSRAGHRHIQGAGQ